VRERLADRLGEKDDDLGCFDIAVAVDVKTTLNNY
jgi:hypothetical protein